MGDEATKVRGALPAGHVVGDRYRIERVIGDGASGIVYVAERVGDEDGAVERVALKVIHRHLVRDRQISRRFVREASILRKLRCPNLVPLLDFGETDDGILYMALELVEGRALDQLMLEGPLEIQRSVDIVRQVCAALESAHSAGIVHRDLKPGNVTIEAASDDAPERARVLDFGMAKVLRGNGNDSLTALTEQNMVFGTPEYMAPEQARGDEVDARCDVYAAGVMLYELLTGSVPFESSTPIGMMTAHLMQEPPPPSNRAPGRRISPALEAVVLHALAKRASERYPSAASLADALDRALSRPADVASTAPPPAPDEADDLATRDTEHAMGPASTLRPAAPDAAGDRAPALAEAPERPSRMWIAIAVIAALLGIALGIIMSLMAGA
jgi:serine/threonine-protein kinase